VQTPTRILFLYPNERGMSTVPPAIALLSQILKDAGHSTDLFDTTFYLFDDELTISNVEEAREKGLNVRPILDEDDETLHFKKTTRSALNDFEAKLRDYKPDLIAVSCTETTFERGYQLVSGSRSYGIPNLFGGVFPTFAPDLVMSFPDVDSLCVGEGEQAILQIANSISDGENWSSTTNVWFRRENGKFKKNSLAAPVDINQLPLVTDIGIFGEKRFYRPMGGKVRRLLPVETHRGCPYRCSFCNSPAQNRLYGSGDFTAGSSLFFRKKSLDLVKQEILNHIEQWKVEYIYFWADTFLAWSSKEFNEFCEMYSEIRLPFWCQTRIETVTAEKIKKLRDVGLNRITFGLEHGNEIFRKEVIKREYSNEQAIKKIQLLHDFDIPFSVNNIIGFPDETRELAFNTIELNRKLKSDSISCSIFVPFHGTELRKYSEKRGYIEKDRLCTVSNSDGTVLTMPQWDGADINRLRKCFSMYVKFPKNRWAEIRRSEKDVDLHDQLSEEYRQQFWANSDGKIERDLAEAAKGIF